jgi:septal ring factor EnvC (AmiA/AmiB activator)
MMVSGSSDTVRLKPDTTYFTVAASALAAAFLALSLPVLAQETDRVVTEALARRATERLQSLQREADRLASEEGTLLGDLRKLELERQIKAEELRQVDTEHSHVTTQLTATNARIRQLQQEELSARPDVSARLVAIYKLGQGRYLRLLLSTSNLQQVGRASRIVAALAKIDRDRIASHQRTLDELKTERAGLEARNRRLASLTADAKRAQAAANRAAQAHADLIRDIDRRRDLNAQLAGELQGAAQKLQMTLRDLANGVAVGEPAVLPLGPFRGELDWPVAGTIRYGIGQNFGARSTSSNGMEIAAAEGAFALAIHGGMVAFADTFAGFGNLVILDHGSRTFSLYGNLLDIAVKKGARIEHGQAVGTVGSSVTGPAGLYFELRVDDQTVDPLQWLRKR